LGEAEERPGVRGDAGCLEGGSQRRSVRLDLGEQRKENSRGRKRQATQFHKEDERKREQPRCNPSAIRGGGRHKKVKALPGTEQYRRESIGDKVRL